ncbi:TfuA-like protein [Amycolatopsis sp. PS_44_ISF1]|uniref:TfuA-like protein n=1 Tax=Amycolatopsis sp. PS_44_ISF1 TaxID=2974917 RepID=UPI0028DEB497|nr:TfuA-like protein [Amycolatopsis sp. PS_44_ISF1]MDT8913107.1 TfuA-like protein [Amycolatopsis sp. PS_44_ISF1]
MPVHVFLGPTLAAAQALPVLPGAVLHPPAAHGDLLRPGFVPGDVVVLVDGYYHHSAPVRHKEILALLQAGVQVVGCASMGALRAAELHRYGMAGRGVVFGMYRDGLIDADDEVAVLHGPAPEYRRLSVALVVLRHAAEAARRAGALTDEAARSVVERARSLHYTERTWEALHDAETDRLRAFLADHPREADVKAADALEVLAELARGELPTTPETGAWAEDEDWRNWYIDEWQTEFAVEPVDGVEASLGATIRYQQIHLEDFPARWRRLVLAHIAGPGPEPELAGRALRAAAGHGLTPGTLTAGQTGHWLTPAEADGLPPDEALVRILVRSYRPRCPTSDLARAEPGLGADPAARRAVAEAEVVNGEVASWASDQHTGQLKAAVLGDHLARVWRVGPGDAPALLAAARDRGFPGLAEAVEAVRPFFLRSRFLTARGGR